MLVFAHLSLVLNSAESEIFLHSAVFSLVLFAKLYRMTGPCWSSPVKPTSHLAT